MRPTHFSLRLRVEDLEGRPRVLLQDLPTSVLPSGWFERGQVLMGFWRAGAMSLKDAWRLL